MLMGIFMMRPAWFSDAQKWGGGKGYSLLYLSVRTNTAKEPSNAIVCFTPKSRSLYPTVFYFISVKLLRDNCRKDIGEKFSWFAKQKIHSVITTSTAASSFLRKIYL